jgi:hypothetical protein
MLISGSVSFLSRISRWQIFFARSRFWPLVLGLTLLFSLKNEAIAQATINVPKDESTIQAGINAAKNGDTVLVAPGTYTENIDFMGKAITVMSSGGAASTIIDGDSQAPVVTFGSGERRDSILNGFTIENGAGIAIGGSAPTILNNIVTNNLCWAINVDFGSPLIQGNVLTKTQNPNGSCLLGGSGLMLRRNSEVGGYDHSVVLSNIIEQNSQAGDSAGGGIEIYAAEDAVIEGNIIRNNATTDAGGGINSVNSESMLIAGNLIYGNSAESGGGGIHLSLIDESSEPFLGFVVNNTVAGNTVTSTTDSASQIYLEGNLGPYAFVNNIVVGSDARPALTCGTTDNDLSVRPLVIDHNDVFNASGPSYGGACAAQTGTYGNISADPLFANALNGDYHLASGSPAADAGNNSVLQLLTEATDARVNLAQDIAGSKRIQDATGKGYSTVDMGAYENAGVQENGSTTIVLTPSAYEVDGGQLTLTAKLISANGTPTGVTSFFRDQKQIGVASLDATGSAIIAVPPLTPGTYAFTATYAGAGTVAPGISVKIYVLVQAATTAGNATSTVLTSSLNPATYGQAVTFTATVSSTSGTPAGTVVFSDGSTTLATVPVVNAVAAYTTSTLAVGSHTIMASFEGSSGFANSSGSVVETITDLASTTTLTVTPNPTYVLASTTLTAKVAGQGGTPAGTVSFSANGTSIGTATVNAAGVATLSYGFQSVGTDTVSAVYSGDSIYSGSTASPVSVNVLIDTTATTVSASPNPAPAFQSTMLIARVASTSAGSSSAVPGGTVTFYDGATSLGTVTLNVDGSAATSSVSFQAGTHAITAVYSGNSDFSPSTSAAYSLVVNPDPTLTVLSAAPNPAQFGAPVLFNAAVSSIAIPAGTVTFFDAGTAIGTAAIDANGNASFVTSSLAVGTHAITASYAGNANFGASVSGVVNEVILAYAGNFSITVAPSSASVYTGAAAEFTVAVAPTGGWNGNVTLSCTQLPANASCAFGSSTIAGGDGTTSLKIQTAAPQHATGDSSGRFPWVGGAGTGLALALLMLPFRLRRSRLLMAALLMVGMGGMLTGCGAGPVTGGTPPGVYNISVNATYTANGQALVVQSAVVKLTVKTLF